MAKRKLRTLEELREALEDFYYEYDMFRSLAEVMATGALGEGVASNALLESFTIHTRVVLDFFYAKQNVLESQASDDVIAEDFLSEPEKWGKTRPGKTDLLSAVHKRVGKEVAHLTYARQKVTPETKPWRFAEIAKQVAVVARKFLEIVPQDLLSERWSTYKKEREQAASSLDRQDVITKSLQAHDTGVTNPHPTFRVN